ncbi:hypothetical protein Agub_g10354 [Astrephomene gubernaculifera]|uniref:Non-specific serine/threonine protein kinase n=1 Tax=Astrephomene gubernaculifera TaxID=47775 RepID=A0AAD3DWK3_9CHLO|nr:hypothetical protein Agub_g10354 [Astrephomene gubernaculifera]
MGGCGSRVRVTRDGCAEFGAPAYTTFTTESGSNQKTPSISRIAWDEHTTFLTEVKARGEEAFAADADSVREERDSALAGDLCLPSSSSKGSSSRIQARDEDCDKQLASGLATPCDKHFVNSMASNYSSAQRAGCNTASPPASIETPKQRSEVPSSTNKHNCQDAYASPTAGAAAARAQKPACGDAADVRHQHRPATPSPPQHDNTVSVTTPPSPKIAGNGATAPAVSAEAGVQWVIRPGPPIESVYKLGDVLGKGSFGVVRSARHLVTGCEVAVKSIRKSLLGAADVSSLRREVEILHHLAGHPHISQLLGVFEEAGQLHLVLELYKGGDLFDAIIGVGRHSERAAADVMRVVLAAISYCHAMGVAHRDIKPENFMLTADTSAAQQQQQHSPPAGPRVAEGARLKLIDFGLSAFCTDTSPLTDIVGTSYYVAPEVLTGRYGRAADVWSAGVILHIMLTGYAPFDGKNDEEILRAVRKNKLDLASDPVWSSISREGTELLAAMLNRDPGKRATADQLLSLPWLGRSASSCTAPTGPLPGVVSERLRRFARMHSFKKEARRVVAGMMRSEEVAGLVAQFRGLDADRDGKLSLTELKHGLARQEFRGLAFGGVSAPLEDGELRRLIKRTDLNGDGALDESEFLGAVLPAAAINRQAQKTLTAAAVAAAAAVSRPGSASVAAAALVAADSGDSNPIAAAFRYFDADRSGHISMGELRRALAAHHPSGRGPDLRALFGRVDRDADGRISYPEFVHMMLQDVEDEEEEEEEEGGGEGGGGGRQQQPPQPQLLPPRQSGAGGSSGVQAGVGVQAPSAVAIVGDVGKKPLPPQAPKLPLPTSATAAAATAADNSTSSNKSSGSRIMSVYGSCTPAPAQAPPAPPASESPVGAPGRGRSRGPATSAWAAGAAAGFSSDKAAAATPGGAAGAGAGAAGLRLPPRSLLSRGGVAVPGGPVSRASTGALQPPGGCTSPLDWWCDECGEGGGSGGEEEEEEADGRTGEAVTAAARRAAAAGGVRPAAPAAGLRGGGAAAAAAPPAPLPSPRVIHYHPQQQQQQQAMPHPPPSPPPLSPTPQQQQQAAARSSASGARPQPQTPAGGQLGGLPGIGAPPTCPDPRFARLSDRGPGSNASSASNNRGSSGAGSGGMDKPDSGSGGPLLPQEEACSFGSSGTAAAPLGGSAAPTARFVCRPHPPSPPLQHYPQQQQQHQHYGLPAPPTADARSRRHSVGGAIAVPPPPPASYTRGAVAVAVAAGSSPEAAEVALLDSPQHPMRGSLPSGRGFTQPGMYDNAGGGGGTGSGAAGGGVGTASVSLSGAAVTRPGGNNPQQSPQPSPTAGYQPSSSSSSQQQQQRASRRPPQLQPLRLPQTAAGEQTATPLSSGFNWSLTPSTPRTARNSTTGMSPAPAASPASARSPLLAPTPAAAAATSPSTAGFSSTPRQPPLYELAACSTPDGGNPLLPCVGPMSASRARRQSTGSSTAWPMLPLQPQQQVGGPQPQQGLPLQPLTPRSVPIHALSPRLSAAMPAGVAAAAVALHDGGSPVGQPHSQHNSTQQGQGGPQHQQQGQGQQTPPSGQRRSRGRRVTLMGMEELQVSPRLGAGADVEVEVSRSSVPEGSAAGGGRAGGRFAGLVAPASPPLMGWSAASPQQQQGQQRYMA